MLIEDIKEGDYVLACDPDTDDVSYKRVLETYVNETYELIHLTIDHEEITTTPGHPFYVKDIGLVKAGDLVEGAILVDEEGNELHLQTKKWEYLQDPAIVYNFAVEDYHTYYVGYNRVLVHNTCGTEDATKTFMNGKAGEDELARLYGGEPQAYFKTSNGRRFVDMLANGVAHESKVGRTSLTNFVKTQVLKDAELLKNGSVDDVIWHFFKSGVTGKGGPTQSLESFLLEHGITIIRHF